jgi:hypothetical protein
LCGKAGELTAFFRGRKMGHHYSGLFFGDYASEMAAVREAKTLWDILLTNRLVGRLIV